MTKRTENAVATNPRKRRRAFESVAETDPQFLQPNDRAYFCDIEDARRYSRGSHTKVWFAHDVADGVPHRWITSVYAAVSLKGGCAVCKGRQIQLGVNDVASTHPQFVTPNKVAYLENVADARKYTKSSGFKAWFAHIADDAEYTVGFPRSSM